MNDHLGELEQLLLLTLLRLGDGAYGVALRREIERRTGRAVSYGALYTTLDRLEAKGLVSSWLGEPTPERGGRRKKLLRLEPAGAVALEASFGVLRRMSEGLEPRLAELARRAGSEG